MAINVNGIEIPTNDYFIVVKNVNVEKVVANGVIVWERLGGKCIWDGVSLYPGVTLNKLDIVDGKLTHLLSYTFNGMAYSKPAVEGIDLTGYSKLKGISIGVLFRTYKESGPMIRIGIDENYQVIFTPPYGDDQTLNGFEFELDVSEYVGLHKLTFYQVANHATDRSGITIANLELTKLWIE